MRVVLGWIGIALVLFSLFMVATAIVEILGGGDGKTQPSVYAGLIVFFTGTGVVGAWLIWTNFRKRRARPVSAPVDRDQCILDLARSAHGRVTVAEVASHCDLTLDESKKALDQFAVHDVAEVYVSADGVMVYCFPGFMSDEETRRATRL
jgi:hypothetical protein